MIVGNQRAESFDERFCETVISCDNWLATHEIGHFDICINCRLGSACAVRADWSETTIYDYIRFFHTPPGNLFFFSGPSAKQRILKNTCTWENTKILIYLVKESYPILLNMLSQKFYTHEIKVFLLSLLFYRNPISIKWHAYSFYHITTLVSDVI